MNRLEVRVAISPTPNFFRRIHFMAASLERLRGTIGDYELVICVGGDEEPRDLHEHLPWSRNYPIIWCWADRERFRKDGYWETAREIFRQPARARHIMCADADVIFVHDFSDLLDDLERSPAFAGVIAHAPPFGKTLPDEMWEKLFKGYGVTATPAKHEHTGWGFMVKDPTYRHTPPYFNFGMVIAPTEIMSEISGEIATADDFVNSTLATFFRFQIALTLTIEKKRLPSRALPLRYNFPNDPRFDQCYPIELQQIRILHYLRCEIVDREKNFADQGEVAALIGRADLRGSNEVLRRCVEELYPVIKREEDR